jgi:hypothetical protein
MSYVCQCPMFFTLIVSTCLHHVRCLCFINDFPHLFHLNLEELWLCELQVEDSELADVAAVSAGNNHEVGNMIAEALSKVGRKGVVTLEEGRSAENNLYVVEGMQFDRGYISPYFVTDSEKMTVEFENCKVRHLFSIRQLIIIFAINLCFYLKIYICFCAVAFS